MTTIHDRLGVQSVADFDAEAALTRVLDTVADWDEWAGDDNDRGSLIARLYGQDIRESIIGADRG